jgi:hypothetical protein
MNENKHIEQTFFFFVVFIWDQKEKGKLTRFFGWTLGLSGLFPFEIGGIRSH